MSSPTAHTTTSPSDASVLRSSDPVVGGGDRPAVTARLKKDGASVSAPSGELAEARDDLGKPNGAFGEVGEKDDELRGIVDALRGEVAELRRRNEVLEQSNGALTKRVATLEQRSESMCDRDFLAMCLRKMKNMTEAMQSRVSSRVDSLEMAIQVQGANTQGRELAGIMTTMQAANAVEYQALRQQHPNMSVSEFLQFQAFKSSGHGGEEDSLAAHGTDPNNAGATAATGAAGLAGGLGIHAEQQLEDHQQDMPPLGGGGAGGGGGGGGGGSGNVAHM